jgi:uncharacterized protein (DUF2141 family)
MRKTAHDSMREANLHARHGSNGFSRSLSGSGYGFSRDAKGVIGMPSFSAASFTYDGRNVDLTMILHY